MSTMKYTCDLLMKVIRSIIKTIKYKYDLLMKVVRSIMRIINVKAVYITFYFFYFLSLLGIKQLIKQVMKSNSKKQM
jgi:hypothetical protein